VVKLREELRKDGITPGKITKSVLMDMVRLKRKREEEK
jgi:hypothetical protein